MDLQRKELRPLRQQFVNDIKLLTRKAALQKLCARSSNREYVGFIAGERLEVLSECSAASLKDRSQLNSLSSFSPHHQFDSQNSTPRRSQINSSSLSFLTPQQSLLSHYRSSTQDASQISNYSHSRRAFVVSADQCPSISPSSTITSDGSSHASFDSPLENIIFATTQRLDAQRAEPPSPVSAKQKPLLKIKSSITRLRNHYLVASTAGPSQ